MTRVLLVGPGAIGLTVAGAVLQRPEMALAVAARTPFDTIAVELDEERIECEVPVLTDPFAITGPFHLVLLGTKAHQTPAVAPWLAAACGPDTDVVVLQNGITHRERVEPLIGPASLVPTVVNIPADREAPGHVRVGFRRHLVVPDDDPGRRTAHRFTDTFLDVDTTAGGVDPGTPRSARYAPPSPRYAPRPLRLGSAASLAASTSAEARPTAAPGADADVTTPTTSRDATDSAERSLQSVCVCV